MSAEVQGKIAFKHDTAALPQVKFHPQLMNQQPLLIVSREAKPEQIAFANRNGISFQTLPNGNTTYNLETNNFRRGILRALKMAKYFSQHANEANRKTWLVAQIEAEFDAAITGDFAVDTLTGQGQVVLDFDRVNP